MELRHRRQAEEMVMVRCCPIIHVYHLKRGQVGYEGHVNFFSQDITHSATSLPRFWPDVPILVVGRRMAKTRTHS